MFFLGFLLLIFGLFLFWLAHRRQRDSGLPAGRVIYSDTRGWGPVEKPLYDAELRLTGKPDYLVEVKGQVIPVEVKSARAPESPYDSHIFQLAAYCRLTQAAFGKRPSYGIIKYADRTFAIDYTSTLEAALVELIGEIRLCEAQKEVNRSHEAPERCRGCGYHSVCDQKLI